MTHLTKPLAIIGLVYMTSFSGCAIISGDLENRVNRLENQDIVLKQKFSESETQLAVQDDVTKEKLQTSTAQLNANIDIILENIRTLTGRIEVLEHQMEKEIKTRSAGAQEGTDRFMAFKETLRTNEERILRIEQYLDKAAPSTSSASSPASSPATGIDTLTDTDLYTSAKEDYDNGQYDTARQKFLALIQKFPKSKNADNAQYWIGEIYFHQELYRKAILEYEKVIVDYPDGNKVPAAYLKQGLAFYSINDENNARYLLEKTVSNYPDSDEAKIAGDKLKTFK